MGLRSADTTVSFLSGVLNSTGALGERARGFFLLGEREVSTSASSKNAPSLYLKYLILAYRPNRQWINVVVPFVSFSVESVLLRGTLSLKAQEVRNHQYRQFGRSDIFARSSPGFSHSGQCHKIAKCYICSKLIKGQSKFHTHWCFRAILLLSCSALAPPVHRQALYSSALSVALSLERKRAVERFILRGSYVWSRLLVASLRDTVQAA